MAGHAKGGTVAAAGIRDRTGSTTGARGEAPAWPRRSASVRRRATSFAAIAVATAAAAARGPCTLATARSPARRRRERPARARHADGRRIAGRPRTATPAAMPATEARDAPLRHVRLQRAQPARDGDRTAVG
ncbi:hypothetical protein J6349_09840, partial [Burkholderia pseudomallei]|nr:hypothetical protein [Burkholderia pseudomallei]